MYYNQKTYFCTYLYFLSTFSTPNVKIYLFDTIDSHQNLLPLSFTRPLAEFRCGILTIRQKWEKLLPADYNFLPVEYLRMKFGQAPKADEEAIFISGNTLPDHILANSISSLKTGEAIVHKDKAIAFRGSFEDLGKRNFTQKEFHGEIKLIEFVFDIFLYNGAQIESDYELLTSGRESAPIPACVRMICGEESLNRIFIEPGATVECVSINTKEGPVYIGQDSIVMEGACIRGPFAVCRGGEVRMGAKVYEATTIGPNCKVGGEVSNVVFFGYSNKSHDGYLGNAVIGEWCNIGAGVNASNLKNDYSLIRVWNYKTESFMRTDLQFCGLIMGDHSKIGVNCMINTATVMGVGVNVHGSGFPRQFVPCFSEGSPTSGFSTIPFKKFLDTASRVMSRRNLSLTNDEIDLLRHIYEKA